jgi:DNA-directed RNA polymerase specialized sigma24 family protein
MPLPLDATASEEEQRIVEACLAELPEEYRELILLRNYAGASWESVAEETGRPSAAAARMMHARAMVELGKLVRAGGIG